MSVCVLAKQLPQDAWGREEEFTKMVDPDKRQRLQSVPSDSVGAAGELFPECWGTVMLHCRVGGDGSGG